MEQCRLMVGSLILFALFNTNKVVAAANNPKNYSSEDILMSTSTVPVPGSSADDMQQMLDYLNQTVPRDDTGSNDTSDNFENGTGSQAALSPNQLVNDQAPAASQNPLNSSYEHSGKEEPSSGFYIRAASAIASAMFVGHFFL